MEILLGIFVSRPKYNFGDEILFEQKRPNLLERVANLLDRAIKSLERVVNLLDRSVN